MYRSLVRQSFRERKRGKNEQWGEIKCHVNLCMVDIFYLKATRKKLQITQWSYGALQNNARSWGMASWEGFLTACVSTKEKKQDHSAHSFRGWSERLAMLGAMWSFLCISTSRRHRLPFIPDLSDMPGLDSCKKNKRKMWTQPIHLGRIKAQIQGNTNKCCRGGRQDE